MGSGKEFEQVALNAVAGAGLQALNHGAQFTIIKGRQRLALLTDHMSFSASDQAWVESLRMRGILVAAPDDRQVWYDSSRWSHWCGEEVIWKLILGRSGGAVPNLRPNGSRAGRAAVQGSRAIAGYARVYYQHANKFLVYSPRPNGGKQTAAVSGNN